MYYWNKEKKNHYCSPVSCKRGKISMFGTCLFISCFIFAKPHSSVGSVADLRTRGCWFDPRLSQYSFQGLMVVVATGFIPLSPLSVVLTMVMWKSSQWLGKNILWSTIVNPFPHNNTFWHPWETSLLKTLLEKEKLLIMSNFSFSHKVFYPFE